jgi:hypothetical protein
MSLRQPSSSTTCAVTTAAMNVAMTSGEGVGVAVGCGLQAAPARRMVIRIKICSDCWHLCQKEVRAEASGLRGGGDIDYLAVYEIVVVIIAGICT